ncbi:MAG: DUF1559 domain-containing protein [Gemmataceae bacterium]|nr:DUF1559 domain-containing protein [Gemmataceae bacterium]
MVSLKVSAAWDLPALKPLRDWLAAQPDLPLEQVLGVGPADLDRVTVYWPVHDLRDGLGNPLVVATTRKPYNEARVVKNLTRAGPGDRPRADRLGPVVLVTGGRSVAFADDTTLVLDRGLDRGDFSLQTRSAALVGQLFARRADGPLAAAPAAAGDHPLVVGLDVSQLPRVPGGEPFPELAPYAALFQAKTATLTADLTDTGGVAVALTLAFPDAAAAKRAGPVLEEALADLAKAAGDEAKRGADRDEDGAAAALLFGWVRDGLKGAKVEVTEAAVVATASAPLEPFLGRFVAKLPKALTAAREATEAQNNLKQVLLGLHNHHDTFGFMPGDVSAEKTAWSWRVQILPFIEQENLYKQLDLKLPWDDPRNEAVLEAAEMPKVYEVPGRPAPKGQTYWRSFTSARNAAGGQAWLTAGERGPRFAAITDGLSNTFAVVEAGESVPWYAPDVLGYDPKKPLPPLGAKDARTFLAGMGDGSVQPVRRDTDEKVLRGLTTRDGGEVVLPPWEEGRPRPAAKSAPPVAKSAAIPAEKSVPPPPK